MGQAKVLIKNYVWYSVIDRVSGSLRKLITSDYQIHCSRELSSSMKLEEDFSCIVWQVVQRKKCFLAATGFLHNIFMKDPLNYGKTTKIAGVYRPC